jgi:tRNA(fMet)-specific endonuclease VapC
MAMRLALDTNRYTDLCRDADEVVTLVEHAETVFLPFAVLGELRAGFSLGKRGAENERRLRQFPIPDEAGGSSPVRGRPDHASLRRALSLFRQLRRQGTPIPTNDLWTAALVLQHDLVLCDRDRHFDHLLQLTRV